MKKKVTSTDIAHAAGVSQSTVSMILNKKYDVSFAKDTVERVENAAKELQKILSRSDETHAGAMKQLRRNPTAASSRFKDVLEELKKYTSFQNMMANGALDMDDIE